MKKGDPRTTQRMIELARIRIAKQTPEERSAIARNAVLTRWHVIPTATNIEQVDRQTGMLEGILQELSQEPVKKALDAIIRVSLTILAWERHRLVLEAREPRRVEQFEERTETTAEQASKVSQMTTEELRAMVEGKASQPAKGGFAPGSEASKTLSARNRARRKPEKPKNNEEHTALKVKPIPLTPEIMRDDDE